MRSFPRRPLIATSPVRHSSSSIRSTFLSLVQPDDFHGTCEVSGTSAAVIGPSAASSPITSARKPALASSQATEL